MSQPFFSVIIPTRNRSDLVASAVASVLNQTFNNYELIVSDNSDDQVPLLDALTKLAGWRNNPRCKVIRPGSYMHMPDHWEFCNEYASGEYVLILTDRFVMRPSTLAVLAEKIKSFSDADPDIILWNVQSVFDYQTGIQATGYFDGTSEILSPIKIVKDFAMCSSWADGSTYFNKLPRGMNSGYKRTWAAEIKAKHARIFPPLSPDYSSAFLFLAYAHNVLYIDLPFYMSHGDKSTGMNSAVYGIHMLGADVDPLEGCPLKIDTVFNSVVRDFLAMKALTYPRLEKVNIDTVGYYLSNYREIIDKGLIGSPLDLKAMMLQWLSGVEALDDSVRKEISNGKLILDKMRVSWVVLLRRKLIRQFGLLPFQHKLLSFLIKRKHVTGGRKSYQNVIEASTETDYLLRCNASDRINN